MHHVINYNIALKEEVVNTMTWDVSERMFVCTMMSRANVCGGDVIYNSPFMHVMSKGKNVESICSQESKEC